VTFSANQKVFKAFFRVNYVLFFIIIGSGLYCGGPSNLNNGYPAFSLYCLHRGDESVEEIGNGNEETMMELKGSRGLLMKIQNALAKDNVAADIVVVLLTLLCIILASIVTYLCYSRGISSLSRYVM
jgi:hypothetical protein